MQPNPPSSKWPQPHEGAASGGPPTWTAALLLAIAIGSVYGRALDAAFLFDDDVTIVSNKSIISLWPLFGTADHPGPLRPPIPRPTAGRPLVNLSFALNYYFGRLAPIGYHVVNLLIHFVSALLLFAIVKRTLRLRYFANQFETSASWLALAVALDLGAPSTSNRNRHLYHAAHRADDGDVLSGHVLLLFALLVRPKPPHPACVLARACRGRKPVRHGF